MYTTARSEDSAKGAIDDPKPATDEEAIWPKLDPAPPQSIKDAAEEFLECVHRNHSGQCDLIHVPPGRNRSFMPFSITRAFRSPAARIQLNASFKRCCHGLPIDELTADGYDMVWGTNAFGMKLFYYRRAGARF